MRYTYADYVRDHQKKQPEKIEKAPEQVIEVSDSPIAGVEEVVFSEESSEVIVQGEVETSTINVEAEAALIKSEYVKKLNHNKPRKKKNK